MSKAKMVLGFSVALALVALAIWISFAVFGNSRKVVVASLPRPPQPIPTEVQPNVSKTPRAEEPSLLRRARKSQARPSADASVPRAAPEENILEKLRAANFIYNRVGDMWRGEPVDVILKLVPSELEKPQIPSVFLGKRTTGTVKITPEVSVELRGSAGFAIVPLTEVRKTISFSAPTSWQWKVTPEIAGENNLLTLSIYAHVDNGSPYTLEVYEDKINVKVTIAQQARDIIAHVNPLWAFFIAVIPPVFGGITWLRRKLGKRSPETATQSRPDVPEKVI
jgi:hypothetical protein